MAINVLTETPQAIGGALAPANADTLAEVIEHHRDRIVELETALRPFAKLADTWTVTVAAKEPRLLTISNGERMCGIDANEFIRAQMVLGER